MFGLVAWALWQQVQGQRDLGFSSRGEIRFDAFSFIFKIRNIEEDYQEKLFDRIMVIDHIATKIIDRKNKLRQEAEKRKGKRGKKG